MDVLTLVATCGLAARAALFVPLGGAPACASAASALRGDGHEAVADWQPDIAAAAHRFDIPEAWIAAVMRAESGSQATVDGRPIRSPAGAIGLMQVMPQTYAALRARYGLGTDPRSPRDNILAGAARCIPAHRKRAAGRDTALPRRTRAADRRHVSRVAGGRRGDGIEHEVCSEGAGPGSERRHQRWPLRDRRRAS